MFILKSSIDIVNMSNPITLLLGKIIFITTVLGTPVSQGSLWQYNSLNILFCLIYDDAGFKDCGAAFVEGLME